MSEGKSWGCPQDPLPVARRAFIILIVLLPPGPVHLPLLWTGAGHRDPAGLPTGKRCDFGDR